MQKIIANRFEVLDLLGEGGVALVYRANDLQTNRIVAIKCLKDRYVTEGKIRRRFMREARVFRRLKHRNIVEMFDYGEDEDQRPYICLEFVEGQTLATLRDTPFELTQFLTVMDEILAALAFAHAQGVYHRDVKPDNVVVRIRDGTWSATLLDFGFARLEDEEGDQSKHDAFGTPLYMAPEQISHAAPIGPASDLYSVGIVLYEFLTGQPPFTGAHGMAVALRHLTDDVPTFEPLARLNIPPGLKQVVLRALEKSPADRYSTAADMRRALAAACGTPPPRVTTGTHTDASEEPDAGVAVSANRIAHLARREAGDPPEYETKEIDVSNPHQDTTGPVWENPSDLASRAVFGREAEREWLMMHARNVAHGRQGRLLLLDAARGMGRRQLIAWLQARTKEEGRLQVLSLGHRRHAGREYGGLRGVLEELLGGIVPEETANAELGRQVERWRTSGAHQVVGRGLNPDSLRDIVGFMYPGARVGEQAIPLGVATEKGKNDVDCLIAELVALASCSRPILLTVGGLDRAGSGVASFLIEVMRWIESCNLPILLVVSYPQGDNSDGVVRTLASLKRAAGHLTESRNLAPFEGEDMRALLQRLAPQDDAVAEAIAKRTDGNPYFATELVHLLWQQGELEESGGKLTLASHAAPSGWPKSLAQTVLQRSTFTLQKMPDGEFCGRALKAASILGEAFDYEVVQRFLTRTFSGEDRVERAIETLIEAKLFSEASSNQGDRLHFVHQLLQVGLLDSIDEARAKALHALAADALIQGEDVGAEESVRIAYHLEQAGRSEESATYWQKAASVAGQDGNSQRALGMLQKANELLALCDGQGNDLLRARIWLDLGGVELQLGITERPKVLAARIINWAKRANETGLEGRGFLLLGDVLQAMEAYGDAIRAYDMAITSLEKVRDLRGIGHCLLGRGRSHQGLGNWDEALHVFGRVAEVFGQLDDVAGQAQMYLSVGELCIRSREFTPAVRSLQKAKQLFRKQGASENAVRCAYLMAEVNLELGRIDIARMGFESILSDSLKDGLDVEVIATCNEALAKLEVRTRQWQTANTYAKTAAASFEDAGDRTRQMQMCCLVGLTHVRLGQLTDAWAVMEKVDFTAMESTGIHNTLARILWCWSGSGSGALNQVLKHLQALLGNEDSRYMLDVDLAWAYGGLGESLIREGQRNRGGLCINRAAVIYDALGEQQTADELRRLLKDYGSS